MLKADAADARGSGQVLSVMYRVRTISKLMKTEAQTNRPADNKKVVNFAAVQIFAGSYFDKQFLFKQRKRLSKTKTMIMSNMAASTDS